LNPSFTLGAVSVIAKASVMVIICVAVGDLVSRLRVVTLGLSKLNLYWIMHEASGVASKATNSVYPGTF
jgi:hypothetical protein